MKSALRVLAATIISMSLTGCEAPYQTAYKELTYEDPAYLGGVAIYGCSRTGSEDHARVVSNIMAFDPVAVFHTGDMVLYGHNQGEWTKFNTITRQLRKDYPFYPLWGNHDAYSEWIWYDEFDLPNNERYYAIDIQGIHYVALDSTRSLEEGSSQMDWLRSDLEANSLPVVLMLHHVIYSTGMHWNDNIAASDNILDIIATYGIRVVVSSHEHDYERLVDDNGVTFVIAGGGGSPLRPESITPDEFDTAFPGGGFTSVLFASSHHHLVVNKITGSDLLFTVFDKNLDVLDSFIITP
jgi:hypothetical protein